MNAIFFEITGNLEYIGKFCPIKTVNTIYG